MATYANIARDVTRNQCSLQQLQYDAIVIRDLNTGEVICTNREKAIVAIVRTIEQNEGITVLLKLLDKESGSRARYIEMLNNNWHFLDDLNNFYK